NPPVLTPPVDIIIAADSPTGAVSSNPSIASFLNGATALDAGSGVVAATSIATTVPATFPLGTTTVSFEAYDNAGNRSVSTATVRVVEVINDLFPVNAVMPSGWLPFLGYAGWHVVSDDATEGLFSLNNS
ncbi:MAG: HYR domain-containing protein, partial [Mariprofundaceae bacterium]